MPKAVFSIEINSGLVASAQQMHQVSRIGDDRHGPNQSFEAYLSDLVSVAIVERKQQGRAPGANREDQLRA